MTERMQMSAMPNDIQQAIDYFEYHCGESQSPNSVMWQMWSKLRAWLDAQPAAQPNADGVLPCPFCGSINIKITNSLHAQGYWCGWCRQCCTETGYYETQEQAIAAWNRRAQPTQAPRSLLPPALEDALWEMFDGLYGADNGEPIPVETLPEDRQQVTSKALDLYTKYREQTTQMPAPDWSKAPKWAQWWACDSHDTCAWFQERPVYKYGRWSTLGTWHQEKLITLPLGIDWRLTLQRRPEAQP